MPDWSAASAWLARHRAPLSAAGILLLTMLLFALDLGGVWGLAGRPFGPSPWWGLVTVIPGCTLLAVSGRRPLLALAVGTALVAADFVWFGTVGMLIVFNELLYAATMSLGPQGRRRMLATLVIASAAITLAVGAITLDLRTAVVVALLAFVLLGTSYFWAAAVRGAQEVAELHRERAADAVRLAELRENEVVRADRVRMAGDLHDVVAGRLSAIALHSEAALSRTADERRDRAALGVVREVSVLALEEMRAMILLLRSGEEPVAAADRLEQLPAIAVGTLGIDVELDIADLPGVPVAVEQAAARVVRESLLNAAKHAAGGAVSVRVAEVGGAVRIEVVSRGGAPTGAGGAGLGLVTMRERAAAFGGTFEAGPVDGGWRVLAELPKQVVA